jgi:alpha-glucosidase
MTWLPALDGVLAFSRGPAVSCLANLSLVPVDLPAHSAVLLASGSLTHGQLPPDTAVWLRA